MANSKGPDRRTRKRAEREERIINIAEELILAKGFEHTTIDEIALRADVSKGAVYLHFRNKDEIYFVVVTRALRAMDEMFRKAVKEGDCGLKKFRSIGYAFYEYTKSYPRYAELLYSGSAPSPGQGSVPAEQCRSLSDSIGHLMISSIEEGKNDGSIRSDVDATAEALIISSSMQGFLRTILRDKDIIHSMKMDERYLVDQAIDLYGRSLINADASNVTPDDERTPLSMRLH